MRCNAGWRNGAWGGVFVSSPAYADGYVDGTGNNIYYGFKTDAKYAEAHFNIDVEYYDTFEHARDGGITGIDPLGKFVRVHYLSNCNNDATADEWKFRPMWWFGVPAGLKDPQYIHFKRIEKLTNEGKKKVKPVGSSKQITTDANGYGAVSDRHYNSTKEWSNLSNFYFSGKNIASKGWKQLVGLGDKDNSKTYDNAGDTEKQWNIYKQDTQGLKGIFVDWESAGRRWYDMTYVSEMEDETWKNRDEHPLRFAAGVYRFAGNWHYATAKKSDTPKIADHFNLTYPAVTKVKDTKKLTGDEQEAVKNAIVDANKNAKYYSDLVEKVEVSEKGDATITFKDKTTRTMPASLLVTKDETDKDKYKPTLPTRTPVVNLKNLTPDEKTNIRQAIIDANGGSSPNEFLKHVKKNADSKQYEFNVKEDGSVEVTYEDDSKLTIPAEDLVFQGPKISDWAPYVVPDVIEVDDLTKLTDVDVTKIKNAFDTANADLDVYSNAKKKDSAGYLAIDKQTGNATIKWADGSTTVIDAWQFLKQKPKTTPSPETQPPAPTPAAEKEFIVEAPQNQSSVNFDPFNAKDTDLTDPNNTQSLNSIKGKLKKCVAKDAKDNKTPVTIKDVEFKIEDGKGVVVFHADNYKDAKYPMSVFLKQKANKQTSQTPSTETKTETDKDNPGNTFTYKVTKTEIEGNKPTAPEAVKALKQFVKDNYDNVSEADLATVADSVDVKKTWTPKAGTKNMGPYGVPGNNGGPMLSISLRDDNGIKVIGRPWAENDDGGDWDSALQIELITIQASDLYVKKGNTQQQKDTTIDDLKKQAKDLLQKRTKTDGLTNDDLKRAGISDPDQLNDAKIDEIAKGQTAEKDLRDLIRKLTDAKKAERKYNEPGVVEFDKGAKDDAKFKEAVKAFLKANYTNPEVVTDASITSPLTLPSTLTAKADTVYMGIDADGIKSLSKDASNNIVVTPSKGDAFTVKVTYKQKEDKPAPSEDLEKLKKQAKELIDRNPKLTKEQKDGYKTRIGQAKDKQAILDILKEANEQAGNNNVKPGDIKKKEKEEKKKRENEQKEKDKKEREEDKKKKEDQQLKTDKKNASDAIDNLNNLTSDEKKKLKDQINGGGTGADPNGATTPEAVHKILDDAKNLNEARELVKVGELPFLSHGKGDKDADDKALKELIGSDASKKDAALTALEAALAKKDATADEIKNALDAAKRQNTSNEQNAKNAGIAKLDAKKAELDAAYKALPSEQQASAKTSYEAATKAIDEAKTAVNNATKPSDIMTAVNGVDTKIDAANGDIKKNTPERDKTGNTNDLTSDAFKEEKENAKGEIDKIPGLTKEEKDKYKKEIDDSNHKGDPEAIVNRAKKHQKIEDAKKQIADLKHLNNAQKQYYENLLDSTDASDHVDEAGKSTGKDDIDDALEQALNLNGVMKRLADLATSADELKKDDKDKKYSSADNDKKSAFDAALKAANTQLDKVDGADSDNINADGANALYGKLLEAMKALDNTVKDVDLYTSDLQKEYDADVALKEKPVYKNATKNVKEAFDAAVTAAKAALDNAKSDPTKLGATAADQQNAIGAALANLVNTRKALDGKEQKPTPVPSVDKTGLQALVDAAGQVKDSDAYKYADANKQGAYDKAISDGQSVLAKTDATADEVANAVNAITTAKAALDGKKPTPTPTPEPAPTPTPSVDKSHLQQGINGSGDVKKSDDYTNAPSDKKQAYDHALDHANEVNNDPNATQDQVNQAAEDLKKAENDLKPTPTPTPTPSPLPTPGAGTGNAGSGSEAGYGVNDNAPTTVDKGELNIQIDSAESDLQPGNAGNGNAGSNNAGNAANSGANAGNAGNAGAANANAGSAPNAQGGAGAQGAGAGTGTTGAANAGVDNKAVNNAVENSPEVKQADAAVKQAAAMLDEALTQAKSVAADPHATQAQVDAAAVKLADARKAFADAQANAAKVRAAVRSRVIKGMRSRGNAGIATGANVATTGLMATMIAAIGGAFVTRRMRAKHANRD